MPGAELAKSHARQGGRKKKRQVGKRKLILHSLTEVTFVIVAMEVT